MLDKRGRAFHNMKANTSIGNSGTGSLRRSQSKAEGISDGARKIKTGIWFDFLPIPSSSFYNCFILGQPNIRRSKSRMDGLDH